MRVHFINSDFAKKYPDGVKGFLRGHQKALDFIFRNPRETTKIWMKMADIKLPEAIVLKTWDFYRRSQLVAKPIKGMQTTMQDAIEFKHLGLWEESHAPPDTETVKKEITFDPAFSQLI